MIKSSEISYTETRSNLRINEKIPVSWMSSGTRTEGKGLVRNISASGMLLETDRVLRPGDQSIFSFAALSDKIDFIPQKGRLVWLKKKKFSRHNSLCGIEFLDTNENVLARLRQRIQVGIIRFTNMRKFKAIIDITLFAALLALMAYVIWSASYIYKQTLKTSQSVMTLSEQQTILTNNYIQLYHQSELKLASTETLYNKSESMLANVKKDLNSTKVILSQTENMLAKTRTDLSGMKSINEKTNAEFALAKTKFENTIASLQEQSTQLKGEISGLNDKIAYYEGNVKDQTEGRALLSLYKEKMKLVKLKISAFNREAKDVKNAALSERDRIRSILGNNGYFVKDGQSVNVDMKKFNAGVIEPSMNAKKVDIDVKFFK